MITEYGFKQLVKEPTRTQGDAQNILDLVLINNQGVIKNINVVEGISDHDIHVHCIISGYWHISKKEKTTQEKKSTWGKRQAQKG